MDDGRPLTQREVEVVALVAEARTNREIADALYIGHDTVRTHLDRIYRALDLPPHKGASSARVATARWYWTTQQDRSGG